MPRSPAGAWNRVATGECLLDTTKMGGVVEEKWSREMLREKLGVVSAATLTFEHCGALQSCQPVCGEDVQVADTAAVAPGGSWALGQAAHACSLPSPPSS